MLHDLNSLELRPVPLPRGHIWLDPRGLLHIRSLDGSELSLLLRDEAMPGWSSHSGGFGETYYRPTLDGPWQQPFDHHAWLESFAWAQEMGVGSWQLEVGSEW